MNERQAQLERERKKLPTGINCALVPLDNGSIHVRARRGSLTPGGRRSDPPYFGEVPFIVVRQPGIPDIVRVGTTNDANATDETIRELTRRYFYFALRAAWSYVDTDTPANNFSSADTYPFVVNQLGEALPVTNTWKGFSGKHSFSEPPPLSYSPYGAGVSPSTVVSYLKWNGGTSTVYTLEDFYFYRGALTSYFADQTPFISPTYPQNTATPDNAGAVLTAGSWAVKFDVYEYLNQTTETLVETKTIGPFSVSGTADSTDFTTWATTASALSWTCQEVAGDVHEYLFRNLRIEQVT